MITGSTVKEAMIAAGIKRVEHHPCSMCHYMTAYVRGGESLFFDPGCNCSDAAGLQPRSWDSAAQWINMQTNPEVRERLSRDFGLTSGSDAPPLP